MRLISKVAVFARVSTALVRSGGSLTVSRKMSGIVAVLVLTVAYVAADAPPLPYAAAASTPSFPATYSHGDESGASPYIQQYGHGSDGFSIQSGIEGYLVPSGGQKTTVLVPIQHGLEYLSSGAGIARIMKFISAKGLSLVPKIVLSVVGVAGLFLLGCVLTTAVCTFTPFCSISFLGWGIARESMRSFLTEDRISATAAFVSEAIRKYQELYGTEHRKTPNQKENVKE